MAQQQHNYAPQSASQSLGDQQWSDNIGTVNNVYNAGPVYYGYQPAQASAAPYPGPNNGPGRQQQWPVDALAPGFPHVGHGVQQQQWPAPDALAPGFPHMGHRVQQQQQPHFGGTNVQTHMVHVCEWMKDFATEREQQILHTLCNDLAKRSKGERDCSFVGEQSTKNCVKDFATNHEEAKKRFWRRSGKNKSQRKGRKEAKGKAAQAKQPDQKVQWVNDQDLYNNAMLQNHNAGIPVVMQMAMQQEAQQQPLPQGFPEIFQNIDYQLDL